MIDEIISRLAYSFNNLASRLNLLLILLLGLIAIGWLVYKNIEIRKKNKTVEQMIEEI